MRASAVTDNPVARYLLLGQSCLFFFLGVCFLLIPYFLLEQDQGGVSNYGRYIKTAVPYTLAFGLCGVLTLYAARLASQGPGKFAWLGKPLALLGALYLVALISTYGYKAMPILHHIHIYASVALVAVQLALGFWFVARLVRDGVSGMLLAAQAIGSALGALNLLGALHVLFVIELFTSLAFAALLVRTAAKLQV